MYQKEYIISTLKECNFNITRAAKIIGIDRSNLHNYIRRHDIKIDRNGNVTPPKRSLKYKHGRYFETVRKFKQNLIMNSLRKNDLKIMRMAEELGIDMRAVHGIMYRLGIKIDREHNNVSLV